MKYVMCNNKLYEPVRDDLTESYQQVDVEKATTLPFRWLGRGITLEVWHTIIAFFADHSDAEVSVRLFYHIESGLWVPWAFPQYYPDGMSVDEDRTLPGFNEQENQFTQGEHLAMGSVHHHCSGGAGQSGKDDKDERNYPGIHITLGNLNTNAWSIHGRVNHCSEYFPVDYKSWFIINEHVDAMPEKFKDDIIKHYLTVGNLEVDATYPDIWKSNLHKPKSKSKTMYYGSGARNGKQYQHRNPTTPAAQSNINGWYGQREYGHLDEIRDAFVGDVDFNKIRPEYITIDPKIVEEGDFKYRSLPIYKSTNARAYGFESPQAMKEEAELDMDVELLENEELEIFKQAFITETSAQGIENDAYIILHKASWCADAVDSIIDDIIDIMDSIEQRTTTVDSEEN